MSYGCVGQYSCLLYNVNVASSITTQGRAFISSAGMCFEMLLNNNVKFGSLNEVVEFINHIVKEKAIRRFNDKGVLDENISIEDCFAKLILSCGYRWIPNNDELEVIWRILNNLGQEDINRIYYKNNLFSFCDNKVVFNIINTILHKLKRPLYTSANIPEEIADDIKLFSDLLSEYVYYRYLVIDRIDRMDNSIQSVIGISDTDSAIVSLDGWYRYVVEKINGEYFNIANYTDHPLIFYKRDEDNNLIDNDKIIKEPWSQAIHFVPKKLDYNFKTDEIEEKEFKINPLIFSPNKNVKYSIINILSYALDRIVNDYMEHTCECFHSLKVTGINKIPVSDGQFNIGNYYSINGNSIFKFENGLPVYETKYIHNRNCRMILKNEFLFGRVLLTSGKKHYASLQIVQEGNIIPEDKQLDIKGIDILYKSTSPTSTKEALQKILLEDILKTSSIDQMKVIKDLAIFEKELIESVKNGDRTYYKPSTIKSMNSYENPMRIQGIKASIAWNNIKTSDYPTINLEERNAVDIAKVNINKANADKIADKYPEVYNNILRVLNMPEYKGNVDAIAIPLDIKVPEWITEFIDYDAILTANISGFPIESIGCMRMDRRPITYTNIVQL